MNQKIKNVIITFAFPVVMFLLMEVITYTIKGTHVLNSVLDVKNLIRSVGITCTIAYALSFNLMSGRFDLSIGAQRLVSTTIGCLLAIKLGFSGIGLLAMSILFGLIFGAIAGIVFVITRVPPMVLGIGMGLIYECIAFAGSKSKGLSLFGLQGIEILTDINFTIFVICIVAALVMTLLGYTKFGYHMRAIQGSQRIAQASGIHVFRHAILCYTFAGGTISVSGIFSAAFEGGMATSMGFASNGPIYNGFFPMFLGQYMAKWSNQAIGIIASTVTLSIFSAGLSALKLTSELSSVINMMALLLFLVFLANKDILKNKRAEKERIALAKEKRQYG